MIELLNLGYQYISDFVKEQSENAKKYELKLILDEHLNCPRLENPAPLNSMYGKYWYRSGINESMVIQLKSIVEEITNRIEYDNKDIWLDIACNDGTMFKFIPNEFEKIGIDPADDSFYAISSKLAKVSQKYFSSDSYWSLTDRKAKVITIIAMFYDLDDPYSFLDDINEILDDNGILVLQLSYTPLMIKQMAFDNICHEHIYYYSLDSLKRLFELKGLKIVDCSLNETNGGSFRVYAMKNSCNENIFGNKPFRDVCKYRIQSILSIENELFKNGLEKTWSEFENRLSELKESLLSFISIEKRNGKIIGGYGASTKGNTLLQYFEIDKTIIDFIAERSEFKFGLKTIGTDIPIISEEEMRKIHPDYLLVLPWHFISSILKREENYLKNKGKFILPCPNFEIIEK